MGVIWRFTVPDSLSRLSGRQMRPILMGGQSDEPAGGVDVIYGFSDCNDT